MKQAHLLQLGVGGHAALGVALRQLKHAVVEAVEARQRHKLERIPQLAQLLHPNMGQVTPALQDLSRTAIHIRQLTVTLPREYEALPS